MVRSARLMLVFAPLLAFGSAPLTAAPVAKGVTRCGWMANPTPGNWWLTDRDATWTVGMQGGYQAPGMDKIPDLTTSQWIKTNGYYGYGCGCITGTFSGSGDSAKVTRILSYKRKPLSVCQSDKSLPAGE